VEARQEEAGEAAADASGVAEAEVVVAPAAAMVGPQVGLVGTWVAVAVGEDTAPLVEGCAEAEAAVEAAVVARPGMLAAVPADFAGV